MLSDQRMRELECTVIGVSSSIFFPRAITDGESVAMPIKFISSVGTCGLIWIISSHALGCTTSGTGGMIAPHGVGIISFPVLGTISVHGVEMVSLPVLGRSVHVVTSSSG